MSRIFFSASLRAAVYDDCFAAVLRRLRSKNGRARPVREKISPHFFSAEGASRNARLPTDGRTTAGKFSLCFLAFLLVCGKVSFAEEMVHRMDGYVEHVDPQKRKLTVLFEHPVTEETMKKEFFVSEDAGFKDFKKLSDLKKNDLLTVDYREDGSKANAIYVIRVPIEKSYVSAGELAGALTQIKPGKGK